MQISLNERQNEKSQLEHELRVCDQNLIGEKKIHVPHYLSNVGFSSYTSVEINKLYMKFPDTRYANISLSHCKY